MAKKIIVAEYDISIKGIQEKINELKTVLNNPNLGKGFSDKFNKDLLEIEKQLQKVSQSMPGAGATTAQIDKYGNKLEDVKSTLKEFVSGLSGFEISDKYLQKNIESLKEYIDKLEIANKEVAKLATGKIADVYNAETTKKGQYGVGTLVRDTQTKMDKAAREGKTGLVQSSYNTYLTEIDKKLALAEKRPDGKDDAIYQSLLRDKEAMEKLLPIYMEFSQKASQALLKVKSAESELTNETRAAGQTMRVALQEPVGAANEAVTAIEQTQGAVRGFSQEAAKAEEASRNFSQIEHRIKNLFSVTSVFYTLRRVVRGAVQDFQALDKQFNEIAIVSDYSTKEMWKSFSTVNKTAQEFGVTTENVLEVQNLYYHQGKDMAEVNKLTAQTLTLAKITGMDYERATSDLTAALNAYNIAAEDAVRVTDTIAAMDTNAAISSEELMTALTKTASIAANAGMSLESTEVFLTKMIETTREAPENLGTALKTIIARFGEVKQEIDGEEIELADINRVDTALKSIGISLLDTAGQIRDLDGVFMELSSKWDDLDRNTQRYIATIAAGSRQQSRFIAMMEDYDRTLELTEIAQDSAGLGARQLAKSQESIETSVNRLKSTWQEFYSSLITSGMIKGVLELANGILSLVNTLNDVSPFLGTIITALTIWAVKTQIIDKIIFKLGQSLGQATAQTTANTTALRVQLKSLEESQLATMLADETTEEYIKTLIKEEIQLRKNAMAQNTLNQAKKRNMTIKNKKELGRVKVNKQFEKTFNNNNIDKGTSFKNIIRDAWSSGKQASLGGNSNNIKNWRTTLKNNFSRPDFAINNFKSVFSSKGGIGQVISGKLTSILSKITPFITKIVTILPKIISLVTKLFNPITALIAALTIGFAIYRKYTKLSLDDTKKVEKLQKSQEEYNKTLKEYNDLKEKAKIIEKYSDRKNLSAEQLQEQQEAAKALVNEYPELLNYIDEEGNYYLKDAEAIQAVIDKKQELLDQEATNYTELRLKYAQEGIYADETTSAGKTMKNIQSYAASLDEDQLKEAAKEIDAAWEGIQFNSSNYKKMMKAFGDGKKFSFDEKDMSSLFEGDIGEDNWNEFLEAVKENPMILENEEDLADALHETNAYTRQNAEQVAEAFVKMNKENGMLFSQLIQGAAEEYSQIEISYAQIQIEKGDFAENLSTEVKEGLSEIALQQAIETAGGEEKWKDLDDEDKTDYIEDATESIVQLFEELSKTEIQGINAAFTSQNVGALTLEQAADIDITAITREKQIEVLETFWNQLPVEIQRQIPKDIIRNGETEIIQTLFQIIKKSLGEDNINEFINNLATDFDTSAKMFLDGVYDTNPFRQYYTYLKEMSIDQLQAYARQTGNMSIEEIAPYSQTLFDEYAQAYGEKGKDSALKVFNALVGNDFTTQEGIEGAIKELSQFGYTAEQVWDIAVKASNGIENISLDNFASATERAKKELDSLISKLEGATALMEGTASFEQLSTYMNDMLEYWTQTEGITRATELISQLGDSVVATGDGFKIGATAGAEYANSAVEMTKQLIILRIAQQELAMETEIANGTLTDQAKANYEMSIALMKQQYAMIDAQSKKSIQDGLIKDLEKAKEKADNLLESLKDYVTWLREFDKYQNINSILESLEQDFENIEFEMSFSTNTDVIEKDIEDTITNINTRMAATQGKLQAAQSNMQMQRDVIEKRNSQYVSFDADGTAIVNAQELQKLQEQIKNADEEHKPVLQAKYDEIIANVEAYKKEKDIVNESTKDLQELAKAMEDFLKAQYDSIMKVENKLVDARMAAEDKELDAVKEKYDAIKEENDKYLESVQDMIDEERKIRDRADKEQNVKDKEKKLAMMRMDTSGIYTNDIRALEKELEGDYRDLEDDAVDKAIDDLSESFSAQAKVWDKEIEYLENALEYKREKMTEYNTWAQELMMQGSDAVIDYLKANDEEYYTGTAAAQANWELEWENAVTQGIAANNQMKDSLDPVFNSIMACKDNADGFKGAIEEYGETALATNGEIEGSVETLTDYYASLVSGVSGLDEALGDLEDAYDRAAIAAWNLKQAQDYIAIGEGPSDIDIDDTKNNVRETYRDKQSKGDFEVYIKDNFLNQPESVWDPTNYKYTGEKVKNSELGWMYKFIYDEGNQEVWFREASVDKSKERPTLGAAWYKRKYAKGGYVDYTGPAWVDGTKSHPEYMLNATQTAQFETLVAALSAMFSNGGTTPISQYSQKIGDAYYNFHINVEKMANDYDVDDLVNRLEDKLIKATQYRNITVVKKQK